jgi:hypothetical protein
MRINKIYEAALNSAIGRKYYASKIAPLIISNGMQWKNSWNGKKACLMLSYDPDEKKDIDEMKWLLSLLKRYDLPASIAAIGMLIEKYPKIFSHAIDQDHELINHTYSHPDNAELNPDKNFHLISREERFSEINICDGVAHDLLDYKFSGFRIPHFGNQFIDDIYPMLTKLKYKYSSSTVAVKTKNQGFPFKVGKVWELPLVCCQKHPFCIFDTAHAFRSRFARHDAKTYLMDFENLIRFGIENHMFINLYHDPQDLHKFDYDKLLKIIDKYRDELLITTYGELTNGFKK